MKPQCLFYLALIFLFGSLRAQTLNYMPPNPGGFEVLVGGRYIPTTDELYLGKNGKTSGPPTSILQTDLRGQYALSNRNWIFAVKLPIFHQILASSPFQANVKGFGNTEVAMRYLMHKPDILGKKKFLLGEMRAILPPTTKRDSLFIHRLGFDGYGLETGIFGGNSTDKWHTEAGIQLGVRARHTDYLTAYGKLQRQFQSWQIALTLNGRHTIRIQESNPFDNTTGLIYFPQQKFLTASAEVIWFRSRFLGFGVSTSRVLLGYDILAYTAFGGGVYVKWN